MRPFNRRTKQCLDPKCLREGESWLRFTQLSFQTRRNKAPIVAQREYGANLSLPDSRRLFWKQCKYLHCRLQFAGESDCEVKFFESEFLNFRNSSSEIRRLPGIRWLIDGEMRVGNTLTGVWSSAVSNQECNGVLNEKYFENTSNSWRRVHFESFGINCGNSNNNSNYSNQKCSSPLKFWNHCSSLLWLY